VAIVLRWEKLQQTFPTSQMPHKLISNMENERWKNEFYNSKATLQQ